MAQIVGWNPKVKLFLHSAKGDRTITLKEVSEFQGDGEDDPLNGRFPCFTIPFHALQEAMEREARANALAEIPSPPPSGMQQKTRTGVTVSAKGRRPLPTYDEPIDVRASLAAFLQGKSDVDAELDSMMRMGRVGIDKRIAPISFRSEYRYTRPDSARPVTDDGAREYLARSRSGIKDTRIGEMVDHVVGRDDLRVMYIGGDVVYDCYRWNGKEDKEKLYSSGGCYKPTKGSDGKHVIELPTRAGSVTLVEECAHYMIDHLYQNAAKPFPLAKRGERVTANQSLWANAKHQDTRAEGSGLSQLRRDLEMNKPCYQYRSIDAEIPAKIITLKATGGWTTVLARKYPRLDAYVEQIILPYIAEYRVKGSNFTPRTFASIEEMVAANQPSGAVAEKFSSERYASAKGNSLDITPGHNG